MPKTKKRIAGSTRFCMAAAMVSPPRHPHK
jgi:hypothetical protein